MRTEDKQNTKMIGNKKDERSLAGKASTGQ